MLFYCYSLFPFGFNPASGCSFVCDSLEDRLSLLEVPRNELELDYDNFFFNVEGTGLARAEEFIGYKNHYLESLGYVKVIINLKE